MNFLENPKIRIQKVPLHLPNEVELFVKREDEIHRYISGNKYRKLKYNLQKAKSENHTTLLTFGGAYSNHIAATAAAGSELGFQTIGIIRGEELQEKILENPTLRYAQLCGMQLIFIYREEYRKRNHPDFLQSLREKIDTDYYLIPEGGTNELAVQGCEEIIGDNEREFDIISVAVGTGGTMAGIIKASANQQQILGFPALKGDFLSEEIRKYTSKNNWQLINNYHFGGYGKVSDELVNFINEFYRKTKIPLDPIYTGKMIFGIFALAEQDFFKPQSKILAIHTGGLQGIEGFNQQQIKKHKNIIIR